MKIILPAICFMLVTACGIANPIVTSVVKATSPSTSLYQKWTAHQVIVAFETAGLEVGEYRENDPYDLFGSPPLAFQFIRFFVPSRGEDAGGVVFSFSSQEDFNIVYDHYKDSGWYDSGLYFPWVFTKDNILMQINGILSDTEAQKYGDALSAMR